MSAASPRSAQVGGTRHVFRSLAELMAKASPRRSDDELAGLAAASSPTTRPTILTVSPP